NKREQGGVVIAKDLSITTIFGWHTMLNPWRLWLHVVEYAFERERRTRSRQWDYNGRTEFHCHVFSCHRISFLKSRND
ncbi:hypothetical protein, partial [Paenibacillus validus]|uniref:hypothetical protein n=1 Tax=Paenibacillus validus TaxID=44253 RepID=UPI001C3FB212